jgi:hypothetical protein
MELQAARQIVATLAQGIHPVTGELMPEDSPYNAPPVIRALFAVSQALEEQVTKPERPPRQVRLNAGKPWTPEDDDRLQRRFAEGAEVKDLADELGRTQFGVETRLVKFGKLPPREGMRLTNVSA